MTNHNWVKIGYYYKRDNDINNNRDWSILNKVENSFAGVKKAVNEFVKEWTGTGEITITSIESGPYLDQQLTDEQEIYFIDKVYSFKSATVEV